MKFADFSIRRFRAFDSEVPIPLSPLTVFIGPNNLGKSTVLNAINLFVSSLESGFRPDPVEYKDDRDYPKCRTGRQGRRWPTKLSATITLDENDLAAYKEYFGEAKPPPPARLRLSVEFKRDEDGYAEGEWSSRDLRDDPSIEDVTSWLAEHLDFVYVPATRGDVDMQSKAVMRLVRDAMKPPRQRRRPTQIEKFYDEAVGKLQGLEGALAEHARRYMRTVRSIHFDIPPLDILRLVRLRDIVIDDGTPTSLACKGDGFKSLFALALLQFIAEQKHGSALVFGIEEPESHLHAAAIYDVKSTLRNLSSKFQVLLTTHSPILVQRDHMRANIVVNNTAATGVVCTAHPAQTLGDIRESLGVLRQDSLYASPVVIFVEGATEEVSLPELLTRVSPELREAVAAGQVSVQNAGGASKMAAHARVTARDIQSCLFLVDSDEAGVKAQAELLKSGFIEPADVFRVTPRAGCTETEYEDCFDPNVYLEAVAAACGIELTAADFESARTKSGGRGTKMKKWSEVMQEIVTKNGHVWDAVEKSAKTAFGNAIASHADRIQLGTLPFLNGVAAQVRRHLKDA